MVSERGKCQVFIFLSYSQHGELIFCCPVLNLTGDGKMAVSLHLCMLSAQLDVAADQHRKWPLHQPRIDPPGGYFTSSTDDK